jgi:hypothetical protein
MSANSIFSRMAGGILQVLGEPAVMKGSITKINVERGAQVYGIDGYDDMSVERDVATIDSSLVPNLRETFQFIDADNGGTEGAPVGETFRLEKRLKNNGFTQRFVVLKVA